MLATTGPSYVWADDAKTVKNIVSDQPELISVSAARRPGSWDEIGTSITVITEKQIQTQQRRRLNGT